MRFGLGRKCTVLLVLFLLGGLTTFAMAEDEKCCEKAITIAISKDGKETCYEDVDIDVEKILKDVKLEEIIHDIDLEKILKNVKIGNLQKGNVRTIFAASPDITVKSGTCANCAKKNTCEACKAKSACSSSNSPLKALGYVSSCQKSAECCGTCKKQEAKCCGTCQKQEAKCCGTCQRQDAKCCGSCSQAHGKKGEYSFGFTAHPPVQQAHPRHMFLRRMGNQPHRFRFAPQRRRVRYHGGAHALRGFNFMPHQGHQEMKCPSCGKSHGIYTMTVTQGMAQPKFDMHVEKSSCQTACTSCQKKVCTNCQKACSSCQKKASCKAATQACPTCKKAQAKVDVHVEKGFHASGKIAHGLAIVAGKPHAVHKATPKAPCTACEKCEGKKSVEEKVIEVALDDGTIMEIHIKKVGAEKKVAVKTAPQMRVRVEKKEGDKPCTCPSCQQKSQQKKIMMLHGDPSHLKKHDNKMIFEAPKKGMKGMILRMSDAPGKEMKIMVAPEKKPCLPKEMNVDVHVCPMQQKQEKTIHLKGEHPVIQKKGEHTFIFTSPKKGEEKKVVKHWVASPTKDGKAGKKVIVIQSDKDGKVQIIRDGTENIKVLKKATEKGCCEGEKGKTDKKCSECPKGKTEDCPKKKGKSIKHMMIL